MESIGKSVVDVGRFLGSLRALFDLVPIADETKLPPLVDLMIDRDLECLVMWRDGPSRHGLPTLRRALDADERRLIEKRVADLRNAAAPFGEVHRSVLARKISGMLGAFPVMDGVADGETAASKIAGYIWTCREQPPWAIARATELARSGKSGLSMAYCPSEPEFNALVIRLVAPYIAAQARTAGLLSAQVYEAKQPSKPAALRPPTPPSDGRHAARAIADLELRRHEAAGSGGPEPPKAA